MNGDEDDYAAIVKRCDEMAEAEAKLVIAEIDGETAMSKRAILRSGRLPRCEFSNDGEKWRRWSWRTALTRYEPEHALFVLEIVRRLEAGECLQLMDNDPQCVRMTGTGDDPLFRERETIESLARAWKVIK